MNRETLPLRSQLLYQLLCLLILLIVLFPILWVFAIALDPRDIARAG